MGAREAGGGRQERVKNAGVKGRTALAGNQIKSKSNKQAGRARQTSSEAERQAIEQISMLRCEIPRWNGTTTTTTLTTQKKLAFLDFSLLFSDFIPSRWVSAIIRRVVRTVGAG